MLVAGATYMLGWRKGLYRFLNTGFEAMDALH